MIEFRLLGSLDLKGSEGETFRSVLAQPKRVALLAYLLVAEPNGFHRRDKLIGLFWAEQDQDHARAALRKAVYRLRQSLGEDVLVSQGDDAVGLAEDAVWCDAVAFEAALDAGEPEEALELYRGDLLEGFYISDAPEFERWLELERGRLRQRAAEAAWALAEREAEKGNGVEAAHWARRAATLAADDEGAIRRAIEFLDGVGDRAGALKEYEAFARRLREAYEAEPSPETQALIAAICEREVVAVGFGLEQAVEGQVEKTSASSPAPEVVTPATEPTLPSERRKRALRWRTAGVTLVAALAISIVAGGAWLFLGGNREVPGVAEERPSVAVLPFENHSGLTEDDYFTDGFHDELLTQLWKISGLSVRGRISVRQYRDNPKNLRQIGEELNARYLLEGSVLRAGQRIRISVQLIDALEDEHVWAETYDRQLSIDDLLAVQSDVAVRVAEALRATLTTAEKERIAARPTENLEAYEFFLRGKDYLQAPTRSRERRQLAAEMFGRAVELDPDFAEAFAWLSRAHGVLLEDNGLLEHAAPMGRAVQQALSLGPNLASPHLAAVRYHLSVTGQAAEARRHLAISSELEPGNAEIPLLAGETEWRFGDIARAREHFIVAVQRDPLSFMPRNRLAQCAYFLRRYDEAMELRQELLDRYPDFPGAHYNRAMLMLSWTGDREQARAIYRGGPPIGRWVDFHLVNWDWDDRLIFRLLANYFEEELQARTLDDPGDTVAYYLARADAAARRVMTATSNAYFDSARVVLEERLKERRRYPDVRGGVPTLLVSQVARLGIAYAGLGRREDANRQAREALDLLEGERGYPLAFNLSTVAEIFALTGENVAAIEQLDRLLSIPSYFTLAMIRVDPLWDPVRCDPRFQSLVERYE